MSLLFSGGGVLRSFFLCVLLLGAPLSALAQSEDAAAVILDAVKVEEVSESTDLIGRLIARDSGEVAAAVSGPVEVFEIEVGQRLAKGALIAVIDASELDARRALAAANLSKASAQRDNAAAELLLAVQEKDRAEGLKGSSAYSPAKAEDARAKVSIAEATLAAAEASVRAEEATLKLAEVELARASVTAPYEGVVIETLTERGAYVSAGDALVRLLNDRTLEIEADVPYALLAGLTEGAPITARLDDGTTFSASLRAVVPEEDPMTRTRRARFVPELAESSSVLAAGQSVTLRLPSGPQRAALTVHKDAVLPGLSGMTVFIAIEKDGAFIAEARQVILGSAVGDRFEIISGLDEGDQAIVRGNERLRSGQAVQPAS